MDKEKIKEQNKEVLGSEAFKSLMEKALSNDAMEHVFLGSISEWQATRLVKRATKKVAEMFQALADEGMIAYAKQIAEEKTDADLLFSIMQFQICADFYYKESRRAKDMLKEYHAYVFGGHMLDTIFNIPRREEDMVDYRTLPWRFF